jgi:hypothetical protein
MRKKSQPPRSAEPPGGSYFGTLLAEAVKLTGKTAFHVTRTELARHIANVLYLRA